MQKAILPLPLGDGSVAMNPAGCLAGPPQQPCTPFSLSVSPSMGVAPTVSPAYHTQGCAVTENPKLPA